MLWWSNMKKEIVEFVVKCLACQYVKIKHRKPLELLQPRWKWENLAMDFVNELPYTQTSFDAISVIVNRLKKFVYFLPIKITYL